MKIVLKAVSKKIEKKEVIKNFSYTFEEKKFYIIRGKSGSGKTTLINMIGGLVKPTSGEIKYDDMYLTNHVKFLRNDISFFFQNYGLLDNETVLDNILIALKFTSITKQQKIDLIKETLNKINLNINLNQKIHQLSGGEQQRVALARILLKPSQLILADEPTGNLDEENRKTIMEELKKINQKKMIIMVSHDEKNLPYANQIIEL